VGLLAIGDLLFVGVEGLSIGGLPRSLVSTGNMQ
jgi:hypothetical protein